MKTNHIPVIERLHNKIAKLQSKLEMELFLPGKDFIHFVNIAIVISLVLICMVIMMGANCGGLTNK